jgi:iron(III) transport system substrate-binding protein
MTMTVNGAIDRRTLLGVGAGALVAGSGALAATSAFAQPASGVAAEDAYFAELYAKAKQEGEVTWYIASWTTGVAERVAKAFTETYPGVKPNVVRATGQVIYQRLTQDFKAQVPSCDVFSSTDLGHYVSLKATKMLTPYQPRNQIHCAEIARNYVPDHSFTIADGNSTVMVYNTKLVTAADAPKKWTDLLDPKWMNQVAVAHPGYSGAMGGWVLSMNKLYGWDFFERLKLNKPHIGRSKKSQP